MGWSFGGTQATNYAFNLSRVGERIAGFRLNAAAPIKDLFTFDPVEAVEIGNIKILPIKVQKGSVRGNVQNFVNYYQQARAASTFVDANTGEVSEVKGSFIIGGHMASDIGAAQVRVNTDLLTANVNEQRDRIFAGPPLPFNDPIDIAPAESRWRLPGNDTNHSTIVWYAYARARDELNT